MHEEAAKPRRCEIYSAGCSVCVYLPQRVLLALLLAARLDLALHLTRHVVEEAPEAEAADFFGFVWGEGVRLDGVRGVRRG